MRNKLLFPFPKTKAIYDTNLLLNKIYRIPASSQTLSKDIISTQKKSFETAMMMLLHGIGNDSKTLPNMGGILKDRVLNSLEEIEAEDMTIETNKPEHPICIVDEVLLYEHLYLNKAVLRSRHQSFLINKRLPFMSADRIHRHLTLTSG